MADPSTLMGGRGPITCAGCGLLCDDVAVERSGDAVRLAPECHLGAAWFSDRLLRPVASPATVDGRPADVDEALMRARDLLRGARRPLVYGFGGATTEDARAAIALADRLGALVATDSVTGPWPGAPAAPLRGASTATLGEIRDRSRVVIVWREDPEATHPRLLQRLGFEGEGASSPPGRDRLLVVVDDCDTDTARRAGLQLRWPRERDLEAVVTLHALARRPPPNPSDLAAQLGRLLDAIAAVPHVAFVHGPGLTAGAGGQRRGLALYELVRALAHERHVVTMALPRDPGSRGADDVLAWQTGYSGAVDLASGHPELVTAADVAGAEAVDVALSIESASVGLPGVTEIALGARPAAPDVAVSIRTGAPGVEASGTAHRLDGVPLALQAPADGDAPTAAALLSRLLAEVER